MLNNFLTYNSKIEINLKIALSNLELFEMIRILNLKLNRTRHIGDSELNNRKYLKIVRVIKKVIEMFAQILG